MYEGECMNGEKSGFGKITFKDGSYYEGGYLNGKKHGKGIIRDANGQIFATVWENGKQINFNPIEMTETSVTKKKETRRGSRKDVIQKRLHKLSDKIKDRIPRRNYKTK